MMKNSMIIMALLIFPYCFAEAQGTYSKHDTSAISYDNLSNWEYSNNPDFTTMDTSNVHHFRIQNNPYREIEVKDTDIINVIIAYSIKNGKKDDSISIATLDNKVLLKGFYKDGKKQGFFVGYNLNGMVRVVQSFVDDKKEGPTVILYDDGKIKSLAMYHKGKLVRDKKILFYETGQINKWW